jgi:recombination protein RecA
MTVAVSLKTTKAGSLASDKVLGELKKQHGDQVASKGGVFKPVPRIPTGIFPLDLATGGGIPRSRVSVVYGPESSAKSMQGYLALRQVQAMGETAVLIDAEHAWDNDWGSILGLDTKRLIVVQPDNAEQAVDAVEAFLYAKDVGMVLVDSVSAMVTENEIVSGAEKQIVAGSAAIVSKMVRKSTMALSRESKLDHLPALVAIAQTRYEIGKTHGDPEKFSGGNALKFASSLTLRLYGKKVMIESVSKDKPAVIHVSGIVKKYKCPIVGRSFEFDQALIAHDHLDVGQVEAWNTVASFLKAQGQLIKGKVSWELFGKEYKTLDVIKEEYRAEAKFARKCEAAVTTMATKIDKIPVTAKIDKETGEILG